MSAATHSPALLAANARLLAMRARHRQSQAEYSSETPSASSSLEHEMGLDAFLAALPAHLGWGSNRVRADIKGDTNPAAPDDAHDPSSSPIPEASPSSQDVHNPLSSHISPSTVDEAPTGWPDPNGRVKLYPDIAVGMLREEAAADGRLWLLCRFLDEEGRGVLRIAKIRKIFTDKKHPLYTCGWRQLRKLLRVGNGRFWTRDKTHLWLKSAANVAAALGVTRLTGRPVAIPAKGLTEGMGTVRAHLYAAFHSGRSDAERQKPIARETLASLSGVGRRSQIHYEQRLQLRVRSNFAIGDSYSQEAAQEAAWRKGRAVFAFNDGSGQQGRAGASYVAWQLPNSYGRCHEQQPKGKQRRINRKLKDLVKQRAPGNDERPIEKHYFPDGKRAVQAIRRGSEEVYWWRHRCQAGQTGLWQQLG